MFGIFVRLLQKVINVLIAIKSLFDFQKYILGQEKFKIMFDELELIVFTLSLSLDYVFLGSGSLRILLFLFLNSSESRVHSMIFIFCKQGFTFPNMSDVLAASTRLSNI